MFRTWGLEWLWRIKEERYLWKRYRDDGLVLLRLLVTRVVPLAVMTRWQRFMRKHLQDLQIKKSHDDQSVMIYLSGAASELHVTRAAAFFEEELGGTRNIAIDLSNASMIDARFFGLLIMLRKELKRRGAKLTFTGISPMTRRIFRFSELEYLLSYKPAG
jgi:N-acetylglucosaminyldiphosphoundecaprenol N-acetyl-beta-D-mannosaminyltransferase